MADLCTIRPANDSTASQLSDLCKPVLLSVKQTSHVIAHDLFNTSATRQAVTQAIAGMRCVIFFGHGTVGELIAARNSPLIDSQNIGQAGNAIVIAIACSSSNQLGPDATAQGIESYLGFTDSFMWIPHDPYGLFSRAVVGAINKLLLGGSIDEVRRRLEDGFFYALEFFKTGDGRGRTNSTSGFLAAYWNQQHLDLKGNPAAVL